MVTPVAIEGQLMSVFYVATIVLAAITLAMEQHGSTHALILFSCSKIVALYGVRGAEWTATTKSRNKRQMLNNFENSTTNESRHICMEFGLEK